MSINRKRNHQFSIRISDSEQLLFNQKQTASGLNKTDFFIKMLNGSIIKVYSFDESIRIINSELRKIGVNLNQIAYYANSGYFPQAEQEIKNIFPLYAAIMTRLKEFLDRPLINARIVDKNGES
jgi:hypothetical protein